MICSQLHPSKDNQSQFHLQASQRFWECAMFIGMQATASWNSLANSSGNMSTKLKKLSDSKGYMKTPLCELLIALLGLLKLCSVLGFTSNRGGSTLCMKISYISDRSSFLLSRHLRSSFFVVRKLQREPEQYDVLTEEPLSNQIESIAPADQRI